MKREAFHRRGNALPLYRSYGDAFLSHANATTEPFSQAGDTDQSQQYHDSQWRGCFAQTYPIDQKPTYLGRWLPFK